MTQFDYKSSGVDLDLYEDSMSRVAEQVRKTQTSRVLPLTGGFAGLFRLFGDGHRYEDPVLVSGTDGVGTKLKVAQLLGKYDTIGIDLVAMCVNDCLCVGAEPLFFLDYLAMGKDDPVLTELLVQGIAAGCAESGLALIGGETAIMPDVYGKTDFDLAGFCVGVVERSAMITGEQLQPGQVVLGLASSGFHSNGYSLIRKVVFAHAGLTVDTFVPELQKNVGELLLEPTSLYPRALSAIRERTSLNQAVTGIAHITGGGLVENFSRIVPKHVDVQIVPDSWAIPPLFNWLQQLGNIETAEMRRVFNMGIGLVLVVQPESAEEIRQLMTEINFTCYVLGEVTGGTGHVHWS